MFGVGSTASGELRLPVTARQESTERRPSLLVRISRPVFGILVSPHQPRRMTMEMQA